MRYRTLGRTGLRLSELGFGAWGIGNTSWIGADDQSSIQALKVARDAGVNFFDTALVYGRGHSEELIGRLFGNSEEVVISSKVPPKNGKWPMPHGIPLRDAFPKEHVLECLAKSVRNLQRRAIDLYHFHVWSDEWAGDPEWLETVETIRKSGLARFVSISINDHEPENVLKALDSGLIDSVQVIYNIFDQSPEKHLFPYCEAHGIGVVARVPFDEGGLTGMIRLDTTFPDGDFRNRYFGGTRKQEVVERVGRLLADLDITADHLPSISLRFCISHAAVTSVIAGMRKPEHARRNAEAASEGPLEPDMVKKLRQHIWARNFYSSPAPGLSERVSESAQRISKLIYALTK